MKHLLFTRLLTKINQIYQQYFDWSENLPIPTLYQTLIFNKPCQLTHNILKFYPSKDRHYQEIAYESDVWNKSKMVCLFQILWSGLWPLDLSGNTANRDESRPIKKERFQNGFHVGMDWSSLFMGVNGYKWIVNCVFGFYVRVLSICCLFKGFKFRMFPEPFIIVDML